jgi:hypothetical protein
MKKSFKDELKESIERHYGEFNDGNRYYEMKEIFDKMAIYETLVRTRKCELSSKLLGVSYKTFQRMLLGLPYEKFHKRGCHGKNAKDIG